MKICSISFKICNVLCSVLYTDPDEGHKPKRVGLTVEAVVYNKSLVGVLSFSDLFLSPWTLDVGEVVQEIPALQQQQPEKQYSVFITMKLSVM